MTPVAEALRSLASLAGTTASVRAALAEWPSVARCPAVAKVGRRARLGAPLATALQPLESWPDGRVIGRAIEAHALHGGSLSTTMLALADACDGRARIAHDALMAASASKLSSRLLGALAATCALALPAWHGASPPVVLCSIGAAGVLAGAGVAWMRRLAPRPPHGDPPAATMAEVAAALLSGGLHPARAFEVACPPGISAPRLVRLGAGWADALARSKDRDLRALAAVVLTTSRGTHSAEPLRRFATELREEQRRRCEAEVRRAPVLLVLPLTLCFLPAFGIVVTVPMIPALAGTG
jgi:hypothetical protein